jgi:hypothetical protein
MTTREDIAAFNSFSLQEKAQLMTTFAAVYLMDVETACGVYTVNIYDLAGSFIEVFYNKKTKQVDQIWMPTYEEIDCYLSYIKLPKKF